MRISTASIFALAALLLAALPAAPAAAQLIRVPQDVGNLQAAIAQVTGGGVIELAAGVYPSPPGGFRLTNLDKGFTVRAAAGAEVVLDGGGQRSILRYENADRSRGRRVFFRGLTFRDGFSDLEKVAGAVTLVAADAAFVDCAFENGVAAAPTTGGGAALIHDDSLAVFVDSRFTGNSAVNRAGAVEVFASTLYVHGGRFTGNRVNLPGHRRGSPGGAIHVLDSRLRVEESHFEDNQAGWVGGAVFAFGAWSDDLRTPASELLFSNTSFVGNRAEADPGSPAPGATSGGAFHVEDQTTLRVFGSLFEENVAEQAGAISSYRAEVELQDSVFRGNRAEAEGAVVPVGGAIYVTSSDFADATTDFGAVNRRPGSLSAERTLFQGRFGGTGTAARDGGCVAVDGDINRHFGLGGVPQQGGLGANRSPVELREVAFFDCDVAPSPEGTGAFGGGLHLQLVDLVLDGSLLLGSDSLHDSAGGGGGATVLLDSAAEITGTVFAGNTAFRGAGLFVNGSEIRVGDSAFIANEVSPGVAEPVNQSRGAAIFSLPRAGSPGQSADVEGVVEDSLFAHNVGLPIFDLDRAAAPVNRLRYDGNRFHSTSFGATVYVNNVAAPGGLSTAGLNGLVVPHTGTAAADKSARANQALGSAPAEGLLLALPPTLSRFGDPQAAARSFAAFAWSGASATLNGAALPLRFGLEEVTEARTHRLRVAGTEVDSAAVGEETCGSGGVLCVTEDRFTLDVGWRDFRGRTGIGVASRLTADTGDFFFFDPANIELVTKVLDGTGINGHYWLFYGALSSVEYELRGLDTEIGHLAVLFNPAGNLASVGDTTAFPDDAGGLGGLTAPGGAAAEVVSGALPLPAAPGGGGSPSAWTPAPDPSERQTGSCTPTPTVLCIQDERFAVEIDWTDFRGRMGQGMAVPLTADTGFFFFFNRNNIEVMIKVLDGTGVNGHYWVFYGALSNVEYEVRVTDTETGFTRTYTNPLGNFASVADIRAIPENP